MKRKAKALKRWKDLDSPARSFVLNRLWCEVESWIRACRRFFFASLTLSLGDPGTGTIAGIIARRSWRHLAETR